MLSLVAVATTSCLAISEYCAREKENEQSPQEASSPLYIRAAAPRLLQSALLLFHTLYELHNQLWIFIVSALE